LDQLGQANRIVFEQRVFHWGGVYAALKAQVGVARIGEYT
jgi:hypothetical protein